MASDSVSKRFSYIKNLISRSNSVWEPVKYLGLATYPLVFFVSFFEILFALKNSGLQVDFDKNLF